MNFRPRIAFRAALICGLLICTLSANRSAAGVPSVREGIGKFLGGSYENLAAEQQALVDSWFQEYGQITGTHLDPKTGYDALALSVRTTFEAVTHALLRTNLTDSQGNSLGTALSLVKLVESVHGQIPETRGDEQFRVYVLLQPGALDKLYKSTQFRRTGDNTVYHIGYPINFRQQGGTPSMQFSITRTGLRADIDVDYRSSRGPQALINGHLTAANSDVRAGGNYFRHVGRWWGFGDWWLSYFGANSKLPKSDVAALNSAYRRPTVRDSSPVAAAALDFYKQWLVDGAPQLALSYMSVKANACIASFGAGETAGDGLVRLRIYEHMRRANAKVGKINSLDDALRGVVMMGTGATVIEQANGKLFSVANIPDSMAHVLDCRKRLKMTLAEDLPGASRKLGDYYSVSTVIRAKDDTGPGQVVYQVWHREEGTWKIVSWHLENPLNTSIGKEMAEVEAANNGNSKSNVANPELVAATQQFLRAWLLSRDTDTTLKSVAPEAAACGIPTTKAKENLTLPQKVGLEQKWFKEVATDIPARPTLDAMIQRVDFGHPHMQEVSHPLPNAYLLVRVSDALASMSDCSVRNPNSPVAPGETIGKAIYTLNVYQTMFQPRHVTGDRGTVVLTWARRQNRWTIIAFDVLTY